MRSDAIKKIAGMDLKGLLIARSMVIYISDDGLFYELRRE